MNEQKSKVTYTRKHNCEAMTKGFEIYSKEPHGCLLGREPARINLVVDSTPKTADQIAKEAGAESGKRVVAHFKHWMNKGKGISRHLIVDEEKGLYSVAPATAGV
jgi:hypothetical protein